MDRRFSESYDPAEDVRPDEDVDDWDQAIEAMRDRQKWKKHQEERMRAAGFGDQDILKWKKGDQKSEEDVRWGKAGESREWDRGKDGLPGIFSFDDS
jgi:hypothetical protein